MTNEETLAALELVRGIARRAASLAMAAASEGVDRLGLERKADRSWVTRADREAERLIRDELTSAFPGDSLLGEEMGRSGMADAARVWVIDPIDGTANYVHGIPIWCVAIGLMERGQPTLGVICHPCGAELYSGAVGVGAWLNGNPIRVWNARQPFENTDPIALTPSLARKPLKYPVSVRPRCLGSAQMHLALVAKGACRAGLSSGVYLWDLVAGAALVLAAGGVVVDLRGQPLDFARLLDGRRQDEPVVACGEHSLTTMLEAARPLLDGGR